MKRFNKKRNGGKGNSNNNTTKLTTTTTQSSAAEGSTAAVAIVTETVVKNNFDNENSSSSNVSSSNDVVSIAERTGDVCNTDEFRQQITEEEQRVMIEFGIQNPILNEQQQQTPTGQQQQQQQQQARLSDHQKLMSVAVPLVASPAPVPATGTSTNSTTDSGTGTGTGTTNTNDIYPIHSEWISRFGGGQNDTDSNNNNNNTNNPPIISNVTNIATGSMTMIQRNKIPPSNENLENSINDLLERAKMIRDTSGSTETNSALQGSKLVDSSVSTPPSITNTAKTTATTTTIASKNNDTDEDNVSKASSKVEQVRQVSLLDDDDNNEIIDTTNHVIDINTMTGFPVMGISPLPNKGKMLRKGYDSQSSLAVSESEASSNFDETMNQNFPSSILGSAGMAPAALMATSNWSESTTTTSSQLLFTPRHGNRYATGSNIVRHYPNENMNNNQHDHHGTGSDDDSNYITDPRNNLDYLVDHGDMENGSESDSGYRTPITGTHTPIPKSIQAPTSTRNSRNKNNKNDVLIDPNMMDTDDEYDGDYSDINNNKKRLGDDGDDDQTEEQEAAIEDVVGKPVKPYNVSVRNKKNRTQYPRSDNDNVSSSSGNSSVAGAAAAVAVAAAATTTGLKLPPELIPKSSNHGGTSSILSDDNGGTGTAMYSIPYGIGTTAAATATATAAENNNKIVAGGGLAYARTESYGSDGFNQIQRTATTTTTSSIANTAPDAYVTGSDDDNSVEMKPPATKTGTATAVGTGTGIGIAINAADNVSLTDSIATPNLPGKQGTGGIYQITSSLLDGEYTQISSDVRASALVASTGAGAGFNVGKVSTQIQNNSSTTNDIENGDGGGVVIHNLSTPAEDGNVPLGMIIVGTSKLGSGAYTKDVNDDNEDISLLKGTGGGISLDGMDDNDDKEIPTNATTKRGAAIPSGDVDSSTNKGRDTAKTATESTGIWKQKVCGIQVIRLICLLGVILVIALAVIIGTVVAGNRRDAANRIQGESSSAIQEATLTPTTVTSMPTRRPKPAKPQRPIPLVGSPTISPRPSGPCTDSESSEFFAGVGIGAANCTWLSTRPLSIDALCRRGQDAYVLCPVTCSSCRQQLSLAPSESPTDAEDPTAVPTMLETNSPIVSPVVAEVTMIPTNTPVVAEVTMILTNTPVGIPTVSPVVAEVATDTEKPVVEETKTPSNPPVDIISRTTIAPTTEGSSGPSFSTGDIKSKLLQASPDSKDELDDASSPQAQAFAWIDKSFRTGVYTRTDFNDTRLINIWALTTFAYSLRTDEGNLNYGWLDGPEECDWEGVYCDKDGMVTELRLDDSELAGTIPEEITLIKSLEAFAVQNNAITGPLPSNIGKLTNLYEILMDRNSFSGDIPESITQLNKLEKFHFQRNLQFGGVFSQDIANMKSLKSLNFYYTNMSGTVPDSMCEYLDELVIDCRQVQSTCWTRCFYRCGGNTGIEC